MCLAINPFEMLHRDVRVSLRTGQRSVPEHLPYGPQLRTAFEQMRGKGMAQNMGSALLPERCCPEKRPHPTVDCRLPETPTPGTREEPITAWTQVVPYLQVLPHCLCCFPSEGDKALALSLAPDSEQSLLPEEVAEP